MAVRRYAPLFTDNFIANLDGVQAFLPPASAPFQRLLDRLFDEIVPTICRHPNIGRAFLRHPIRSREAQILLRKLRGVMNKTEDLRELVADDYLLLYLCGRDRIFFLAIKHHRQLSFDLRRFWAKAD